MRKIELKEESYVHIQAFMINKLHLKGNELMVYAMIHGFTQQENQWAECSLAYIAAWIGVTNKKTPMNCINSLLEKGLLEKREEYKNGVKFCQYRAITPSDEQNKDKKKNIPHEEKESIQSEKNFPQGINKNSTPLDSIADTIDENIDYTIANFFSNEKDNSKETLELHNSPVSEKQESDSRISMSLGVKQKQSKEKPLKDMPTRAKEIADSIIDDTELSDGVQECIVYFLEKYKRKNHRGHLPLRNETLQSVVEVMLSSLTVPHDEDFENRYQCVFYPLVSEASEWEDRKEVIDKYFDTDFREKCDYSLVHFTQRDIITHVMQKCRIGEDTYWFYSESMD